MHDIKPPSTWLNATRAQARDTGMALTLVCLLIAWFGQSRPALAAGMGALVLTMTWPGALKPVARVWFGLSHVLGAVMSRVILAVVFFVVLTPVGLLRRAMGKDAMGLKRWKKDDASVFRVRGHRFGPKDVEPPY